MSAHKEPIEGCVQMCSRQDGHLCRQDRSQTRWASLQPSSLHRVRGRQGTVPSNEGRGCVMRVLSEAGSGYLASVVISGAEEEEGEDGRKEKEGYRRKGHMH